ncbi:hypothetical protein D3C80_1872640 [compost metagenome]
MVVANVRAVVAATSKVVNSANPVVVRAVAGNSVKKAAVAIATSVAMTTTSRCNY